MTWPYREGRQPGASESTHPEPANAEVSAVLRSFHDLDADNFESEAIATEHLAAGAVWAIAYESVSSVVVTKTAVASSSDWFEIEGLEVEITCTDGRLSVEVDATFNEATGVGGPVFVALGVLVDDTLVTATDGEAVTLWMGGGDYVSLSALVTVPIGPGFHRVVGVMRILETSIGAAMTINIADACLFALNGRA